MRAAVLVLVALAGCVNGTMIVRDVYVRDSFLIVEKCYVKASSDRLVVNGCHEEPRALPRRVAGAPAALPALAVTPPAPSMAPRAVPAPVASAAPPAANIEVEVTAPAPQAHDGELPPSSTPAPAAPLASAPARSGFGFLRNELVACGAQFRMTGVVNVTLDIRDGKVASARTKEGQGPFEQCVQTRLVGIALPESQPNRKLTVPFALRAR